MHHHNHYYGHANLLARYCGLNPDAPPRIRGYVQHGWNVGCGFNPIHEFFAGAWRFVWSPGPVRRGHTLGRRNYRIIGSPWIYLLAQQGDAFGSQDPPGRSGTLWMPFHGWEGGKLTGDHDRLIREIKDIEPGPVTVSLYFTEYERPEVRQIYEEAGFRVICFGRRGWNYIGANTEYLHQLRNELLAHRRVASNRLATAILYGISLGCEAAVYGDPMSIPGEDPAFGGVERIMRLWPEIHGYAVPRDAAVAFAHHELGMEWQHTPEELKLAFDWRSSDA